MSLMHRKYLFFILKLCISATLLYFIATNFEIGSAGTRLTSINYIFIFPAFLLFLLLLVNNTVRWLIVLKAIGAELQFYTTLKILYISVFFNQAFPSTIGGDVLKIFLARNSGINVKSAINSVMLERVATLSGLILLVMMCQPFLLVRIDDNTAKYVFPILALIAILGIIVLMLLDQLPDRLHKLSFVRGLSNFAVDAKKIFLSPSNTSIVIFLGITGNILIASIAYFTAKAISIDITILDCFVLIPPVILISILPISIAGWGVRESAMVAALGLVGVLEGDAFVMSVLFGLINIVFSLPGGLLWLVGGYSSKAVKKVIEG
jgi:uncharacterized protein (TIRG00374 family)